MRCENPLFFLVCMILSLASPSCREGHVEKAGVEKIRVITSLFPLYDFAREIVKQVGAKEDVEPISTQQANRPAVRPKKSVLDNFNWKLHEFPLLPAWQDALKRYLKQ